MTPKRAEAWLNEVEAMVEQHHLLPLCQKTELQATYEAATALVVRAKLEARRLLIVDGRVVCKHDGAVA
ncbi:hypothetical protein [Oceanidesulfovibrio marinus]|uniref:Uncharacterized protein n=1 Tax=Oceanidesulfovibrio marinus TaxID=370038 RepID=A0A6P1ZIM4_9BACT|nr:hypothetical protein [Oceanidesulfovibrio marinus]QJT09396.1 hypothetical protein E8L03_10780 [Oceanidesulfovibrio marinus]TVM33624.1 hypothetical protein DQK91_10340 [Oceanidesulfovibrio marinus]